MVMSVELVIEHVAPHQIVANINSQKEKFALKRKGFLIITATQGTD